MTDRVLKVTSKNLQDVFKLVRSTGSWDSVNWQKYPPVPGHNPNGDVIIKVQNRSSVSKYVLDAQRSGNSSMCDTHLYGENGFIPCHSVILKEFSPLLKRVILENIQEVGIPTPTNPICITIKEYRLETMIEVLMLFYSGTSYIANSSNLATVASLLDFLEVDDEYTTSRGVPPTKNKSLRRYVSLSDSEDDSSPVREKKVTVSAQEKPKSSKPAGNSTEEIVENVATPMETENNASLPQSPADVGENKQKHVTPEDNHETIEKEEQEVIIVDQIETECKQNTVAPKKKRGRKPKTVTAVVVSTALLSPKPSTSKAARESELRLSTTSKNQEPDDSDGISEYQPEPAVASEVESERPSDEDEDEYEAIIGRRKSRRIFRESDDSEDDVNTTLGERVKLNCRYPKRKRKVIPDYKETESQSSNALTNPEPTPVQRVRNRKLLNSELQCRFCMRIFFPMEANLNHILSVCAPHLKDNVNVDNKQCLLCEESFDKCYKLVKHAALCYKTHALDDDADSDSSVSDAECLAMSIPSVVLKKLSDGEIASILSSIGDGIMIEPHQPYKKYNLNIKVKKEVPDLFPNLSQRETLAQVKILEREQEEYQMEQEVRNRSRNIVPPLILNKSRILKSEQILQEQAKNMFKELTLCKCGKQFKTLEASFHCMSSHKLKRCWICCKEYPFEQAAEIHYRLAHYEPSTPEKVGCPICKVPMKYLQVARHMKMQHLICLQKAPAEKLMDGVFAVPAVPRRIGSKKKNKTLQSAYSLKTISPKKTLDAQKTGKKIKAIKKKIEKIKSQRSKDPRKNMQSIENVAKDQESASIASSEPPVSMIEESVASTSGNLLSQRKRATRKSKKQNLNSCKSLLELQLGPKVSPSATTADGVTSISPMETENIITNYESGSVLTSTTASDDSVTVEADSNRSRKIAKNINAILKGTRTRGIGKVIRIDGENGLNKESKCSVALVNSDVVKITTVGSRIAEETLKIITETPNSSMQSTVISRNAELVKETTDGVTTLTSVGSQINAVSSSPNEVTVTTAQANVSSSVLLVDRVVLESTGNSSVIIPQTEENMLSGPPFNESQLVAVAAITVAHAVTTTPVSDAVAPTTAAYAVAPATTAHAVAPTTTADVVVTTAVGYTVNSARNSTVPVYASSPFGRLFQPISTRVSTPAPVYRNQQTPLPPISRASVTSVNSYAGNHNNQLVSVPQEVVNNQSFSYPHSAQMGPISALERQFGPIRPFGNANFTITNASQVHSNSIYCGTTNINGGVYSMYRRPNADVRHPNALITMTNSPNFPPNINLGSQTFYNGAQRSILPPPQTMQQSLFYQQQQPQLSITSQAVNQFQNSSSAVCQNVSQYPPPVPGINYPRLPPPIPGINNPRLPPPIPGVNEQQLLHPVLGINQQRLPPPIPGINEQQLLHPVPGVNQQRLPPPVPGINQQRLPPPVPGINQQRLPHPVPGINQPRLPSPLASPLSGWRTPCNDLLSSEDIKPNLQLSPNGQALEILPPGPANPSSTIPLIVCGKCKRQFQGETLFNGHFC